MKVRSADEVRVLDSDGFKRRAACLCLRDAHNGNNNNNTLNQHRLRQKEVLLISSAKNWDKWLVPGGGVEPAEDIDAAAERESWEEAGVKGCLIGSLGVFEAGGGNDGKNRTRTHVFLLHVEEMAENWEESAVRRRRWFALDDAIEALRDNKPAQKEYLEKYAGGETNSVSGYRACLGTNISSLRSKTDEESEENQKIHNTLNYLSTRKILP